MLNISIKFNFIFPCILENFITCLDSAYRVNESLVNGLPKIPAQVIGYKYALKIFQLLQTNNKVINESWNGSMNVTYAYGGKLNDGKLVE